MPDRIAAAVDELRLELAKLTGGLARFVAELHIIDRKRSLQLLGLAVAIVVLLVAAVVNVVTLQTVHCALTPRCAIYERNARSSAAVVSGLVDEQDCRQRRALAGLPVPDDDLLAPTAHRRSCAEQTPAAVFPGTP